jgi:4'-phosphopantetheinyl transferase
VLVRGPAFSSTSTVGFGAALADAAARPPGPDEVDLWWWRARSGEDPATGILSPAEERRAEAFQGTSDAAGFRIRRAVLRTLLAGYLDTDPRELRLGTARCPSCGGRHGPPVVEHPTASLRFSVSSAADLCCCAIAGAPVGVDVEESPAPGIAEAIPLLHPQDREALSGLPPTLRAMEATRCWVRGEALLKARGTGIADGLGALPMLPVRGAGQAADDDLTIVDLQAPAGHLAALATRASPPLLRRSAMLGRVRWRTGDHSLRTDVVLQWDRASPDCRLSSSERGVMSNPQSTSAESGTTPPSSDPSAAEALKPYQDYLQKLSDSLGVAGTYGAELQDAQAAAYQRLTTAGEGLSADLVAVQEQFTAEVNAALKSPLVDRVQRTYQAMLDAYSIDMTEAVGAAPGTEIGTRLRRANEAHAQAVSDLNTELARQLSASYQRYLAGIARAYSEADLGRVLVETNEELLRTARAAAGSAWPETGPTGTAPTGTAPSDTAPSDTTPSDTTPSDTTPSDTTPSDTTPSDTGPSDTGPSDTGPADTGPADTGPAAPGTPDTTTSPTPAGPASGVADAGPGSIAATDPWLVAEADWETPEASPWDDAIAPTWDDDALAPGGTTTAPPWEATPAAEPGPGISTVGAETWDDTPPPVWEAPEVADTTDAASGEAEDAGTTPAKKATKKSAAKKTAQKTAKQTAKKTAKKTAQKTAKKSAKKTSSGGSRPSSSSSSSSRP